jgi:NADH:ubiquinone oxidoreductase subunit
MGIFSEVFSWWGGNTWGTRLWLWRLGERVGEDDFGNTYYVQRRGVGPLGVPRRMVTYANLSEASQVPPEWHGWLHYTVDTPPTKEKYRAKPWQKEHRMNMTGTREAHRPQGSLLTEAQRPKATGDYQPWKPD